MVEMAAFEIPPVSFERFFSHALTSNMEVRLYLVLASTFRSLLKSSRLRDFDFNAKFHKSVETFLTFYLNQVFHFSLEVDRKCKCRVVGHFDSKLSFRN